MNKQELAREFEKWAIDKYGVRIKETDIKWWEERQEIWNACAELMSDELSKSNARIEELEAEMASFYLFGNPDRKATAGILLQQEKNRLEYARIREQEIKRLQQENAILKAKLQEADKFLKMAKGAFEH